MIRLVLDLELHQVRGFIVSFTNVNPEYTINKATTIPIYPSIGKVVNFAAKNEMQQLDEVNTSPNASTEAAFKADELIFSPINLLNLESHTFK